MTACGRARLGADQDEVLRNERDRELSADGGGVAGTPGHTSHATPAAPKQGQPVWPSRRPRDALSSRAIKSVTHDRRGRGSARLLDHVERHVAAQPPAVACRVQRKLAKGIHGPRPGAGSCSPALRHRTRRDGHRRTSLICRCRSCSTSAKRPAVQAAGAQNPPRSARGVCRNGLRTGGRSATPSRWVEIRDSGSANMLRMQCLSASMHRVVAVTDTRWSDIPRRAVAPLARRPSARRRRARRYLLIDHSAGASQAWKAPSSAPSSATAPSPSQESSRFLEAAHIRPVEDGGIHRVDNGMLVRSDVRAVRR